MDEILQYIELNTKLRTKSSDVKNDYEEDFFKLMNNSVFGKTMENIRKRVNVRLIRNETFAKSLVSKPNYACTKIFDENLVTVHMKKTELVFSTHVYLGMSILHISKQLMYDFHFNYIKNKYGENYKLLMTEH